MSRYADAAETASSHRLGLAGRGGRYLATCFAVFSTAGLAGADFLGAALFALGLADTSAEIFFAAGFLCL